MSDSYRKSTSQLMLKILRANQLTAGASTKFFQNFHGDTLFDKHRPAVAKQHMGPAGMVAPKFVVLLGVDGDRNIEDVFAVGPFAIGGRAATAVLANDERVLQAVGDFPLRDPPIPNHDPIHE